MKFLDLINLEKQAMLPDASRVLKRVYKRGSAHIKVIAAASVTLSALAVVLVFTLFLGKEVPLFMPTVSETQNVISSVEASSAGEIGMKTNSSLKIVTTEDVSAGELKARLSVSPSREFSVRKVSDYNYELRFDKSLDKNTLYNLEAVYNGKIVYRWAFQTETEFSVTSAYPENDESVSQDSAIEVTFSHADVTGFDAAFSISPSVKGRFEHYGRTWAFVPEAPMNPATLYTVTLKKEVTGPDGLQLKEDYVFSFTTARNDSYAFMIHQQNESADTFLINEAPTAVLSFNSIDISTATVNVYRFENAEAYIAAYKEYVRNRSISHEISALAKEVYQTFDVTPAYTANYNSVYENAAFINYPDPLPMGYYFAEINVGGFKLYQLLQSTTLSVYTVTTNGDYTVWVNDTQTGLPLSGAKVTLEGFDDVKSGEGIAIFKNAKESLDMRVLTIENGDYPYVVVLSGDGADSEVKKQNDLYSYISTNSRLYRASDTVKVFGVILPRKKAAKVPSEAELYFEVTDKKYTVEVSKKGYFELELPLNNTAMSYGTVSLYADGVYLGLTSFTVADYTLPTYSISVTTDKVAYKIGEPVQVTAQVTYMDGTPAANVSVSENQGRMSGLTDHNGCVYGTILAESYGSKYYYETNRPEVHSVTFEITNGTDISEYGSCNYMVFDSSYNLKADYNDKKLTVQVNQFDFEKALSVSREELYSVLSDEIILAGEEASVGLTAEVHEVTYNKIPNGTSYDAINKKVIYSWRYEEVDVIVRTFEFSAENGLATVEIPEVPDENRNYYVIVRVNEGWDQGTVCRYMTTYDYVGYDQQSFNLVATENLVDIGDEVELIVRDGSDNEMLTSGSILCTAISGEIIDVYRSDLPKCTLTFKKEYAPGVFVYGAYFDGKHVYSLGYELLEYNVDHSKLIIEMEKDKEQYQPGDEVSLEFTVTDEDGEPVSTMLNISVMDRALSLVSGDFEDPLYQLYRSRCYATAIYTTCSHRDFLRGELPGGEGGGGEGEWRVDFEDTPYFKTVYTDSSGKAELSFTLPDTITEWNVIARAISQDVQAGIDTFTLRSTQDFFVQVSMNEEIKKTDDFSVAVKGDGIKLLPDSDCKFTVGLTDRDGNEIKTLECEAKKSQYAYLNFGPLEVGLYTVYIQAESGTLKDNVIKYFEVTDSQASVWIHDRQPASGGLSLQLAPQRGNATLTITDAEHAFWQQAMERLKSSAGTRVDQVLGNYLATEFYNTGVWMDESRMDYSIIRPYMTYGGVQLFADSNESDLKVTAKLAAVAADFCDQENLISIFNQYLNNRYAARVDVLVSYFGLASLGEPVLADLQNLYETQTDLSTEEYSYLALAFAYAGDYTTAKYIFDTHLSALLIDDELMQYMMVDGRIEEDLTGCVTLLSNRLGLTHSEKLIRYIIDTDTKHTLLNLELISYLNDHVSDTVGTNKVTISTGDGRNETYSYAKTEPLVLNISPEQASDIRVVDVEGESVVGYAYNGQVDDLRRIGEKFSMGMEMPSSVTVGEAEPIALHVDVPADFDSPVLDLTLPSGVRFSAGTVEGDIQVYSVTNLYNSNTIHAPLMQGSNVVTIYVRGSLPGNFELEPIVVTNATDSRFMATDPAEIVVVAK